jgi:hypothetical protein
MNIVALFMKQLSSSPGLCVSWPQPLPGALTAMT